MGVMRDPAAGPSRSPIFWFAVHADASFVFAINLAWFSAGGIRRMDQGFWQVSKAWTLPDQSRWLLPQATS